MPTCTWVGCGASFVSPSALAVHIRTHTGEKPFSCDWDGCKAAFAESGSLTKHRRRHTGEKPFSCDWDGCKAAFVEAGHLARHRRTHTGEKPFSCDWDGCKAAFAESGDLARHRRTHTGEKLFSCDWVGCKAAFAQSSSLARHRRTHTGERPFKCTAKGCKAAYTDPSHLARHRRSKHPSAAKPTPPKTAKRKASVVLATDSVDNPNPKRAKKQQQGRKQQKRTAGGAAAPPTKTDNEEKDSGGSRQNEDGGADAGGSTTLDVIGIDTGEEEGGEAAAGPLLNPFGLFLRTSLLPGGCGEGCFATASIPGGSLLGSYLEGGGVIKVEEGMELAEGAREYLMDVVVNGRRVVANNTSSMLAKMNHQWGEGANVYFDEEGKFWAKAGGVAVAEVADDDGEGEEEEDSEDGEEGDESRKDKDFQTRKRKRRKRRRNLGGKMAELFVDYGHAYWIHRLLGDDAHGRYIQYARMKSSRRSGVQRKFLKACERKVELLLPNVGVVQSAADGALRVAFWAKREAEEARQSRVGRAKRREEVREQGELEATALAAIAAAEERTEAGLAAMGSVTGAGNEGRAAVVVVKKEAIPPPQPPPELFPPALVHWGTGRNVAEKRSCEPDLKR